jgi:hypothetical protein
MERRRCAVNDVSKSECNHAGTTGKTRPVPNHVLKIHNTITGSSGDHSFLMSVHVVQSRLRNPAKCIAKHSKAGHRHVLDPFPAASSNTRNQKKAASVDKRRSLFRPELNHSKPRGQEGSCSLQRQPQQLLFFAFLGGSQLYASEREEAEVPMKPRSTSKPLSSDAFHSTCAVPGCD